MQLLILFLFCILKYINIPYKISVFWASFNIICLILYGVLLWGVQDEDDVVMMMTPQLPRPASTPVPATRSLRRVMARNRPPSSDDEEDLFSGDGGEMSDRRRRPNLSPAFYAELVKPSGISSPIWRHFSIEKNGKSNDAFCDICSVPVARGKSSSPTNLKQHLKRNHRELFDSFLKELEPNAQNIEGYLIPNKPQQVKDALIRMIVEGHMPYAILKSEGLGDLMRVVGWRDGPPDYRTIQDRMCEVEWDTKLKIKALLLNQKVAITCDGWKSGNNVDYVGVTATWIDDTWSLNTVTLDCTVFYGRHLSTRISERVKEVLAM
jgi:BED zinc finger